MPQGYPIYLVLSQEGAKKLQLSREMSFKGHLKLSLRKPVALAE